MLTDKDREWLEERKHFIHRYISETFCRYCDYSISIPKGWACDADNCPTDKRDHDYKDAAEFEARVAAKMTRITVGDLPCGVDPDNYDCQKPHFMKYNTEERAVGCDMCFIMKARLAVEEEM